MQFSLHIPEPEHREIKQPHVPTPKPLERKEHCERVLNKLRAAGEHGISVNDFPTNFALRSRISNLRAEGYLIHTDMRRGKITRYMLLSEES